MKSSNIGGQAVLEGIMMKHNEEYAVAVRKPDGEISVKKEKYHSIVKWKVLTTTPFIRGVFNFIDSMVIGIKTLTYSASFYEEEEEKEEVLTEEAVKKKEKKEKLLMGATVAIFMVLPYFLTSFLKGLIPSYQVRTVIEGLVRIGIFVLYVLLISRMEDIQRTFMYHGAEHKCINCIEHGLPLTVENVRKSSRQHKRCGTSFLFLVLAISIVLLLLIRVDSAVMRVVVRILLLPVIAGISYEVLKLAGRSDNILINLISSPGLAIQKALTYGQLSRMKIDNMREEHQEKLIRDAENLAKQQAQDAAEKKSSEPRKPMGFIAVSIGEGINNIFKELGVDYIIEGGQTMNPSTDDMLKAIDEVHADTVFILPNNKNIVLAANQAKHLVEDKEIIVIPTKTVPQGITAIINFMPDADAKTNEEAMLEEVKNVKTGQVTYAVRDTHIDDKEIHEGDIMGIGDHGILAVGSEIRKTTLDMLEQLVDEDSELISIYYGEEVKEEDANELIEQIEELYPDADVDAHFGGQPIYYYVLAVE